ncbi:hypothetical protein B0H16DRAFT_1467626 [Mycena metata]|uniref:Uncharacterized protein n=1 Tax=Mycena metata TaxID=1033252 RepID=A0AAD7MV16_9AGAR|nr:hypothetical protein B0H16DRAFT_1467626 [Mycena metata]
MFPSYTSWEGLEPSPSRVQPLCMKVNGMITLILEDFYFFDPALTEVFRGIAPIQDSSFKLNETFTHEAVSFRRKHKAQRLASWPLGFSCGLPTFLLCSNDTQPLEPKRPKKSLGRTYVSGGIEPPISQKYGDLTQRDNGR